MAEPVPVDPSERLVQSVSTAELERRWTAVRKLMRERGIDYLVMQNQEEYFAGAARWFTDFAARHQYPMTVIFPVDGEMTLINCGQEPPAVQEKPQQVQTGIADVPQGINARRPGRAGRTLHSPPLACIYISQALLHHRSGGFCTFSARRNRGKRPRGAAAAGPIG